MKKSIYATKKIEIFVIESIFSSNQFQQISNTNSELKLIQQL